MHVAPGPATPSQNPTVHEPVLNHSRLNRDRLKEVEAKLQEEASASVTSTRTRELLALKMKQLDEMKSVPPTSTRYQFYLYTFVGCVIRKYNNHPNT